MKFGIFDHIDDAGVPLGQLYADRLTIAEAYDRAGFHGYHVAEHHTTPLGAAASPALIFAALSQRTKKLRFGPLVYLLPFYHPLRLIEEVCMIDQLSGGRFQLGVGRGVSMYETAAYGLDFAKTQAMYHEAFQVLLKGLTSDELSFDGEFYKFDKLPMILKPAQKPHPPLWYGVTLPGNAAWPAENNVNIVALGLRDNTSAIIKAYRDTRAKHGLDPDGTLMGVSRHIVVADTDEAALAIARRAYPRWRESFRWLFARHGTEPRVIGIYPPTLRRADGAQQRHRRLAGHGAALHRGGDRGERLQLFRAADGVRRHDADRSAALDRAVRRARSCRRSRRQPALQLHRHHGGVLGVAQRQRGLDVAHVRRAGQLGDEGLEGLEVRRHAFQHEVDLARQHPAFAHQRLLADEVLELLEVGLGLAGEMDHGEHRDLVAQQLLVEQRRGSP